VTDPQPSPPTGDDRPDRPPSPLDAALGISQAAARYGAGLVRVSWAAAAATVEALTAPFRPRPEPGSARPASPASAQPGAAVSEPGVAEPAEALGEGETGTDGTTASESESIEGEVAAGGAAGVAADLGETDRLPPEEPPIPRWDELTLASIRGRLARLDEVQLAALHAWEQSHAGRPAVLSMLENRIAKLRLTAGGAGGGADRGGDRG
jgi:hypothetical protein